MAGAPSAVRSQFRQDHFSKVEATGAARVSGHHAVDETDAEVSSDIPKP